MKRQKPEDAARERREDRIAALGRQIAKLQLERDRLLGARPRAHAVGCRRALSVPVDLCHCGGRDVEAP